MTKPDVHDGRIALVQEVDRGHRIRARMDSLELALWERGYETLAFDYQDLRAGAFDAYLERDEPALVVGHIAAVHVGLARAGRPTPALETLPESLGAFLGRAIEPSTLGDLRRLLDARPERFPLHVRPREDDRLFSGILVRTRGDLLPTAALEGETPVWIQEPVEFLSEWRAYVREGQILRVCNYKGDPLLFPDPEVLRAGLRAYPEAPLACAMDWGVSAEGRTLLVEVNDAYALGNYGLLPSELAALMELRWRELCG